MVENIYKEKRKLECTNLEGLDVINEAWLTIFENEDFKAKGFSFLWSLWVSTPNLFPYGCYLVLQCEKQMEEMPHLRKEISSAMMNVLIDDFRYKPQWRSKYHEFYADLCNMEVFDQVAAYSPEEQEDFWEVYDSLS